GLFGAQDQIPQVVTFIHGDGHGLSELAIPVAIPVLIKEGHKAEGDRESEESGWTRSSRAAIPPVLVPVLAESLSCAERLPWWRYPAWWAAACRSPSRPRK